MKMLERIKDYKKEYVYKVYIQTVEEIKEYDKITKTKMLEEIYKVYKNNIKDICTKKELEYLKKVLNNKLTMLDVIKDPLNVKIEHLDHKYDQIRKSLFLKLIIEYDSHGETKIAEELIPYIKEAIK